MKKIYTLLILLISFFSFEKNFYALTNISINNNKLIPEFNINTKIYNVYVSSKTEIITINVAGEEGEIITGNGSKSLKKGLNEIEIVSYKNNDEKETYILNIYRGEVKNDKSEATLKNLYVEGYEIDFDSNTFSYFIDGKVTDKRAYINYETTSPTSTVKVTGDINLNKTKNIIKLIVTSENKKVTNTYKVTIYKEIEETEKIEKKTSIFDGKDFNSYELKLIIAAIIVVILIILSILFYFLFIRKNKQYYVKIKTINLKKLKRKN